MAPRLASAPSHESEPLESATGADAVSALVTASRALVAIAARSLARVEDSMTLSEFRALVVLDTRGPTTSTSLAAQLHLGPGPTRRILDRGCDEGWVQPPVEGAYAITGLGSDVVAQVTDERRGLIEDVAARMEPHERQALIDALVAFARAAGEPLIA